MNISSNKLFLVGIKTTENDRFSDATHVFEISLPPDYTEDDMLRAIKDCYRSWIDNASRDEFTILAGFPPAPLGKQDTDNEIIPTK